MATYKTIHKRGKYRDLETKHDVIKYVLNPFKTPGGYVGGFAIDPTNIAGCMEATSAFFGKTNGIQVRHITISFTKEEVNDPAVANAIANQLMRYIGNLYQVIYAVHENAEQIHFHMVFNSVSYVTGHRYYGTKREHYGIVNTLKSILKNYGIYRLEVKYD